MGEGRGGDGGAGHRGLSLATLASERSLQPSVTPNPQSAPNSCGRPFTAQLPSRAWMLTSHRALGSGQKAPPPSPADVNMALSTRGGACSRAQEPALRSSAGSFGSLCVRVPPGVTVHVGAC